MDDLTDHQHLWDGSEPQWVVAHLRGRQFPFDTLNGHGIDILDGEPGLMERIVAQMLRAGRPQIDYIDWDVHTSTPDQVLRQIDRIAQRVQKIRTRTTRELSMQALQIAAPLPGLRARLEGPHDDLGFLEAARAVWAIHLELLDLEDGRSRS